MGHVSRIRSSNIFSEAQTMSWSSNDAGKTRRECHINHVYQDY